MTTWEEAHTTEFTGLPFSMFNPSRQLLQMQWMTFHDMKLRQLMPLQPLLDRAQTKRFPDPPEQKK